MASSFGLMLCRLVVVALLCDQMSIVRAGEVDASRLPKEGMVAGSFRSGGHDVRVRRFDPKVEGKRPAVVLLHGCDGWEQLKTYETAAKTLASDGHVALIVRYFDRSKTPDEVVDADRAEFVRWLRGGKVLKKDSRARAHFTEWCGAVCDAVSHARTLPNVDPSRVAIVGLSLGGFVAMGAAPKCDPPVSAVVEMFGGVPEEMHKGLGKLPPVLILHGEEDELVSVAEAYKAAGVVAAQKQKVEIEVHKGVGHFFFRPGTKQPDGIELMKGQRKAREFLKQHLEVTKARP